ncbi:Alkaline nuclease [Stylophora pistillata]|uniref:Alkaline nuclease n=1 Tax=Stylophora pistillata TaxID=50429 RepID=A0A2B4RJS0_STYPI|nr:Alkaline nuclease [Stylophora pistillata]
MHCYLTVALKVRAMLSMQIYLDEQQDIKTTECECPRGACKCSHAAALFIHGIYHLSRADVECQWRKRKSHTSLSNQAVSELFPPPKRYCALSRAPTHAGRSTLYEDLKNYRNFTGLCWLLSPEPPVASKLPMPSIEEIIYSDEFPSSNRNSRAVGLFGLQFQARRGKIVRISEITVGQRNNPAWPIARRGRLTASNFGSILHAKRITPSLLKRLLGEYDLLRVKAIQWGVDNEGEAIRAFTLRTGKTIKETGIWFDSSGILGSFPDGIVDDETILEVKCPYTERNVTIEEVVKSKKFSLEKSESGQGYVLKKEHVYWHQVQGQMYFSPRKFCYFVVWTTKDVAILLIQRDDTWARNIPRLTQFTMTIYSQK